MAEFERHFKVSFQRKELLRLALTHRSFLNVTGKSAHESNERLEFLGDSVLGLVTSDHLFRQFPEEPEGHLTKTKSLLVSKAILSRRALAMGLGRFVLMSHSEMESGGRQRLSILADAFESVLGAIYLDQGFEASRDFVKRWLLRDSDEILADKRHTNYKSHLQEYVQSTFRTHPTYRIRSQVGPDHSKQFHVEVLVGRKALGTGDGRNKKEAEQAAARDALERVEGVRAETRTRRDRMREEGIAARGESRRDRDDVGDREEAPRRDREVGRRDRPRRDEALVAEEPRRDTPRWDEPEVEEPGIERELRVEREPRVERELRVERRPRPESERVGRRDRGPRRDVESPRTASRPAAFDEPVVPPPVELEPLPMDFDDYDHDEVGRPEGPREDLHVDPFAVDPDLDRTERGTADSHPGPMRGRSVVGPAHRPSRSEPRYERPEPMFDSRPDEQPEDRPEARPAAASEPDSDSGEESAREQRPPAREESATESRTSNAFGRRSRRGR